MDIIIIDDKDDSMDSHILFKNYLKQNQPPRFTVSQGTIEIITTILNRDEIFMPSQHVRTAMK